ncbi:hypothetical protein T492DRAFT_840854 [Pavlovales sp. CCMP2436]|nr:hypothetical protein T492DRAFT_840854 [Pavlovales sp. CCMP2436]
MKRINITIVTEEASAVTIGAEADPPNPSIQEAAPAFPVKLKRVVSKKRRKNYLAANARRVQIPAEAKEVRVAAALEVKHQKDAITEYKLAVRLAHQYGFALAPPQPPETPVVPVAVKEEVDVPP